MSKQQYRSKMGIISEILGATMDSGKGGAMISSISRRTNLSHCALTENCQKLIDAGMMQSTNDARNHIFVITEKGMQFYRELQKFIEIARLVQMRF
ncbi:MAG TPA: winged helix-turn-helix domain-containing protein [Candidatus Nitrosotalea sp.]|nr:winged helix-turn-helix domain-containing protein [Candidatus Nitrosotalea sp.]